MPLQELLLAFDAAVPSVELYAVELPALTRLSLRHAHPPSQMPQPTSYAAVAPHLLPALQLLELRSWHSVRTIASEAEAGGEPRMAVPRVHVSGPCIHQHYASLAPLALSLDRVLRVPAFDCSQLTSLQLDLVESLETLVGPLPPMPQLAALEVGEGVGRKGQVEALEAASPQLVRVQRRQGGSTFREYCASRGMDHWQAMVDGAAP